MICVRKSWGFWVLVVACAAVCGTIPAQPEEMSLESAFSSLNWVKGPGAGDLGDEGLIQVPEGYIFTGPEGTIKIMENMGNPTSGQELGFLAAKGQEWFVVFEFDNVGFVKDDEKDKLDADAILESIKKGNEYANKERRKRGWGELAIAGWEMPPAYNQETHNLEWAIRGQSDEGLVVNHNTRILGRRGVMEATLVAEPGKMDAAMPIFRNLLTGFSFKEGHRYGDFVKGDKIAEYGLTALVVGGAAAVAVKTGLFKYLWKIIVVAVVAIGAFFKRIFGGRAEAR